jgi:hypothetical protein
MTVAIARLAAGPARNPPKAVTNAVGAGQDSRKKNAAFTLKIEKFNYVTKRSK